MCWFQKNKMLYAREAKVVEKDFPRLKFYIRGKELLVLRGEIEIRNNRAILDVYQVEIIFPKAYPQDIPILIEIEGRIPRIPDRHINKTGFCCIGPRLSQKQLWNQNQTIFNYISTFVAPFLANQSYYERTGEWVNGGYSHGANGIIEFYEEEYNLDKPQTISMLELLEQNIKLGRNGLCFCGSGKKAKKCHLDVYLNLKNAGDINLFKKDLRDIENQCKDK